MKVTSINVQKSINKVKKKKVSKKNKSAWRKHTDFKDVEEFLETQRQDERIGQISSKANNELFIIDNNQEEDKKKKLSNKQKRILNALKEPKNLIALKNLSSVEDPIVKRNHVKIRKNRRGDVELEVLNPKTQRHIQANKDRAKYHEKLGKKISMNKERFNQFATKDIWKEKDGIAKYPEMHNNQWISRELALHHLKNTGKIVKKLHDTAHHNTSKLKAFEKPHPGMSYNPSLTDHQNLLTKVIEKEKKIVKIEKHLKRVTDKMFSKVTPAEFEKQLHNEKTFGLSEHNENNTEPDDRSDQIEDDDDEPYISVNPPVENKKKDRKSRRKQKEQLIIKNELNKKKIERKKITDILKIKELKDEVVETEEKVNEAKKRRKNLNNKKKFEPKRLSKVKLIEPDIDVNLPEDIAGNLRNVKPESSLLVDRFMNFQKRNILPASVDVGTRKPKKVKRFPRSSHKAEAHELRGIK